MFDLAGIEFILCCQPHEILLSQKMFRSIAFMVQNKMCVSARAECIMCRIDPAFHNTALEHNGCRTVVMKGRETLGYVYIDAEFVATEADLMYWIDLALDCNKTIVHTKKDKPS